MGSAPLASLGRRHFRQWFAQFRSTGPVRLWKLKGAASGAPDQIRDAARSVPVNEIGPLGDREEEFLSTLARMGHDVDTDRATLNDNGQTTTTPGAPAPGAFINGADAARLAGQSHPRPVAEQLADRRTHQTSQHGRPRQPGLGSQRDAERQR